MAREAYAKYFGTLTIGLVGNWLLNYGFDFVLYPSSLYLFGTVVGWAIMVVLSIVISLLTIWFYDWSKTDWVGIEAIKTLRDGESKTKFGRLTSWLLKKSDPVVLIVLSIQFEPVVTALYMRHGVNQYNGFSRRDWTNFILSVIVANIYWGTIVLGGINLFEWMYEKLMLFIS